MLEFYCSDLYGNALTAFNVEQIQRYEIHFLFPFYEIPFFF